MPRWLFWMPLAALMTATGLFGLRAGYRYVSLTESHVIEAAAKLYLTEDAAHRASECSARPAQEPGYWITVSCQPVAGAPRLYQATRFGHVVEAARVSQAPEA